MFNELTASALLFSHLSSMLPVVIFSYMFDGDYSRAIALALLQVAILLGALAAINLGRFMWRSSGKMQRQTPAFTTAPLAGEISRT